MRPNKREQILFGALLIFGGLFAGFFAMVFTASRETAAQSNQTIAILGKLLTSADILQYGIVDSIDAGGRALYVEIQNKFAPNEKPIRLRIAVNEHTQIARQDLIGSGDAYGALSQQTSASLSDLRPGDHVALFLHTNGPEISTLVILYGNPL